MSEQLTLDALAPKTEAVFWIGIDVAKDTFDAAIHPPLLVPGARPDLASLSARNFKRTRAGVGKFLAWIVDQIDKADLDSDELEPRARVVMEATGNYSTELAVWLLAQCPDLRPAIANPGFIAAFGKSLGQRNKTDRADARVIARYGAERSPAPYQPPTPEQRELRDLTRERHNVIAERIALKARADEGTSSNLVAKMHNKRIAELEKFEEQLDEAIKQLVNATPRFKKDVRLLLSIPGVGLLTAATILAELGDLREFKRARALSAYAGVSPRQYRSGASINGRTRMSKKGNPRVRSALYMAALTAVRGDTELARYYRRLVARGKSKMAALGAVMRKLLVLMRALLINNTPYDENHKACEQTCGKNVEKKSPCAI